jgi:hypothetical protein
MFAKGAQPEDVGKEPESPDKPFEISGRSSSLGSATTSNHEPHDSRLAVRWSRARCRTRRIAAALHHRSWRPQQWTAQCPGPTRHGQVEDIDEGEVVGAIRVIAAHPTNPDVVYIGAVNGGIWRTEHARDPHPGWSAETDDQPSLSIGALEFDPTDATGRTLVAGLGP